MKRSALRHALAVAITLAACAPEFALQRPTTIRCTCTCDHERKPCTPPDAAPTRAPARATPAPAQPAARVTRYELSESL